MGEGTQGAGRAADVSHRERLLAGLPVVERRLRLAGISTAVLDGGDGHGIVLLHGPGEFGGKWRRVIPDLARTHRVIAPDLPGHGESPLPDGGVDSRRMLDWLGELIERTCPSPPVLVGHVLGGAIAARFAIERSDRLERLVLVDSLGLAAFRPRAPFALAMLCFLTRPTPGTYGRFMRQCSFDLDDLRRQMGEEWDDYVAYNLELARGPAARTAGRVMRGLGLPRIPPEELARIGVPTTLVWGRHDRAIRLPIAEAASERYGWPLHVIEGCADDPPRDRPEAFVETLRSVLGVSAADDAAFAMSGGPQRRQTCTTRSS
jgi:pimeloyl-ACP methyl ester carboxylesterase